MIGKFTEADFIAQFKGILTQACKQTKETKKQTKSSSVTHVYHYDFINLLMYVGDDFYYEQFVL